MNMVKNSSEHIKDHLSKPKRKILKIVAVLHATEAVAKIKPEKIQYGSSPLQAELSAGIIELVICENTKVHIYIFVMESF